MAYASAWERAFGTYPIERDPDAYWAIDRWDVDRLSGEPFNRFRAVFDEAFWTSIPAADGAVQACHALRAVGFDLVCVSVQPHKFAAARQRNLHQLGFPIETVIATDNEADGKRPKADSLHQLRPVAFVDDYLHCFVGGYCFSSSIVIASRVLRMTDRGETRRPL